MGGPPSIVDGDDALRRVWGVQNQNDDVILEYVSNKYICMSFDVITEKKYI